MVLFTLPGKVGDNLCKIPIIYQLSKLVNEEIHVAVDKEGGVLDLLNSELIPYVSYAFAQPGIQHYELGGQPWDFGGLESDQYSKIYHLGYRSFPVNNLTLSSYVGAWKDYPELKILDEYKLLTESCVHLPPAQPKAICLDPSSSRPYTNERTKDFISRLDLQGRNILAVTTTPTDCFQPFYSNLTKQGAWLTEPHMSLVEYVKVLSSSLLVTTYSYASCLSYIAKTPQICINDGSGLRHFDSRQEYYPGFKVLGLNQLGEAQDIINKCFSL